MNHSHDHIQLFCFKQQKTYSIRKGTELLQAYKLDSSLPFKFGCTQGECAVCAIRIIEGQENLTRPTKQEQKTVTEKKLDKNVRLACQCAILGDVSIDG